MNYNLTTIRPRGFLHSSAFNEVRDSLAWALSSLGHSANITENWIENDAVNIVFGAELLAPNQLKPFPSDTIIYNLEQASQISFQKTWSLVHNWKLQVWDYSQRQFEMWRQDGANVRYVPIGYTPNLTRIPKADVQDLDVLLVGWLTPRRAEVIQKLRDAGLNVFASDKCYGGGRDNLISRAKICLNVHHDGRDMFEAVRVGYYLANDKLVISEPSADDDEYSDLVPDPVSLLQYCQFDKIVDGCMSVIRHKFPTDWEFRLANPFRRRDYTETVRQALTNLTPQEKVAQRYAQGCAAGDMKDYMGWIKDHAKGTCLEIGVRDGASTSALLWGVQASGGVVLSVDINDSSALFAGHPQWKFIQSRSDNPKLRIPELDILFIDGDHSREGYRADLERFYLFVKPGGMILSHDIATDPSLTLEASGQADRPSKYMRDEYFAFCEKHNLRHEQIPGFAGLGVMYKAEVVESDESWQASEALLAR